MSGDSLGAGLAGPNAGPQAAAQAAAAQHAAAAAASEPQATCGAQSSTQAELPAAACSPQADATPPGPSEVPCCPMAVASSPQAVASFPASLPCSSCPGALSFIEGCRYVDELYVDHPVHALKQTTKALLKASDEPLTLKRTRVYGEVPAYTLLKMLEIVLPAVLQRGDVPRGVPAETASGAGRTADNSADGVDASSTIGTCARADGMTNGRAEGQDRVDGRTHGSSCAPPAGGGLVLYDLGCGSGRLLMYAAILEPRFTKCCGIEQTDEIFAVANDRFAAHAQKLAATAPYLPACYHAQQVSVIHADILQQDWSDADVIIMTATCMYEWLRRQVEDKARALRVGAVAILVSYPFVGSEWVTLDHKRRVMSWGTADVWVQQKAAQPAAPPATEE